MKHTTFQILSNQELESLHQATVRILTEAGVKFESEKALDIFRQKGFTVDRDKVLISETQLSDALTSTIDNFTLHARNAEKSIKISRFSTVFVPTGGAPNISDEKGKLRPASIKDFETCCKLVQTSDILDLGGYLMIQPRDIPLKTAHLDMLETYVKSCDKPIFGATCSGDAARDSIEMAAILFGGIEYLKKNPAVIAVVSAKSPLCFSKEQADVIVEMARFRQPLVISSMVMAGISGPISLSGVAVLQNAEILAGLVLSQLVTPGTPVIYGSTSVPFDMKTTISAVGAPETMKLSGLTAQLAHFYNLPCRTGGNLTDSHMPDAQAGAEGSLLMAYAVLNGANFVFHSCGQLGSFISMSFVKWLLDEEICRNIRYILKPLVFTDDVIDVKTIIALGSDGQYLTHPNTFKNYKTLFQSRLFNRSDYQKWMKKGAKRIEKVAAEQFQTRLENYTRPILDMNMASAIKSFTQERKKNYIEQN